MSSQCAWGSSPRLAAASAIFSPCSSVPVMKVTGRPRKRWYRAIASAAMVGYALPMWGAATKGKAGEVVRAVLVATGSAA